MEKIDKKRDISLDFVRTIAVILMLSLHFFLNTKFYITPAVGINMYMQIIIRNFCMIAVPLFMILNGYFNKEQEYNKKIFRKVVNVIIIWLLYSIAEFLGRHIHEIGSVNLLDAINEITSFKASHYSWYVDMYIGLLLLSPMLNTAWINMKKKQQQILIIVLTIITFVSNVLGQIIKIGIIYPQWWAGIYPLTYYFIGKYIKEYRPRIDKKWLILILLATSIYGLCLAINSGKIGAHSNSEILYQNSIISALMAVSVFLIFYEIKIKNENMKKIITSISKLSLDIYLASGITDLIVYFRLFQLQTLTQQEILLRFPLLVGTTFILSYIIAICRNKIIRLK